MYHVTILVVLPECWCEMAIHVPLNIFYVKKINGQTRIFVYFKYRRIHFCFFFYSIFLLLNILKINRSSLRFDLSLLKQKSWDWTRATANFSELAICNLIYLYTMYLLFHFSVTFNKETNTHAVLKKWVDDMAVWKFSLATVLYAIVKY